MARTVTCIMRISSIAKQSNISLEVAALVFTNAGVLLLYIVNLIFAQRLFRAQHPSIGWSPLFSLLFKCLYILVVLTIAMVIVAVVQTFFSLNTNTHRIDRDIQLYGLTFFTVISFLPIVMVLLMLAIPRRPRGRRPDKFGHGRWREKIVILLLVSFLLCLETSYKCGTLWMDPVPITRPMPRYFNKAAYYCVTFTIEILVVALYAILRVDLRFYAPDGASKRKTFRPPEMKAVEKDVEAECEAAANAEPASSSATETTVGPEKSGTQKTGENEENLRRVFTEEETFDENDEDVFEDLEEMPEETLVDAKEKNVHDIPPEPTTYSAKTDP